MSDKLPFDYMNAAGWVKTFAQAEAMAKIPYATHVVVGSLTLLAREGNKGGTNFVDLPDGTFGNSLGLPNDGELFLHAYGEALARMIHDHGKQAVLSGAWFTPKEAGILAELAAECGFDAYEDIGALDDRFERFAAINGRKFFGVDSFYGLRPSDETITLVREEWEVQPLFIGEYVSAGDYAPVIPFRLGETVRWKLAD